ncbi:hypothetical protein H0H93_006135 [Arthromyces matolae]|nr:hypothetical protein H0H93_006135 [Arthromyces matolae]
MSSYSVNVSGIAPTTTDNQLSEFFNFCGKIEKIEREKDKAVIHFVKPNAAKTALMLNGGTLDGAALTVASDKVYEDEPGIASKDPHIDQSFKPRAGIAAEYLAKGYILSDHVLKRAIDIDNEQGISKRFLDYFHHVDQSLGSRALGQDQTISGKVQSTVDTATQKAKSVDEEKGYSKTAHDYYARAIASPWGQKVRSFYTSTSKQVQDIHEEARRIVDQHKAATSEKPEAATAQTSETKA